MLTIFRSIFIDFLSMSFDANVYKIMSVYLCLEYTHFRNILLIVVRNSAYSDNLISLPHPIHGIFGMFYQVSCFSQQSYETSSLWLIFCLRTYGNFDVVVSSSLGSYTGISTRIRSRKTTEDLLSVSTGVGPESSPLTFFYPASCMLLSSIGTGDSLVSVLGTSSFSIMWEMPSQGDDCIFDGLPVILIVLLYQHLLQSKLV